MDTAILITSDYCLLSILTMSRNRIIELNNVCIFIFDSFANSKKMYDSLKSRNDIGFVKYVKLSKITKKYSQIKLLHFFLHNLNMKRFSKVYIGAYGSMAILLFSKFIIRNIRDAQVIYYEEGYTSYILDLNQFFRFGKFKNIIYTLFIPPRSILRNPIEIWLFLPELSKFAYSIIRRIPKICYEDIGYFQEFFSFEFEDIERMKAARIIYFGAYNSRPGMISIEEEQTIVRKIQEKFEGNIRDNIVYKPHPRSMFDSVVKNDAFCAYSMPWEMIALTLDRERKILISSMSTACYTGNVIMDRTDICIFLYKILLDCKSFEYQEMSRFIDKFREMGNEVYSPETEEDLFEEINRLLSNNKLEKEQFDDKSKEE